MGAFAQAQPVALALRDHGIFSQTPQPARKARRKNYKNPLVAYCENVELWAGRLWIAKIQKPEVESFLRDLHFCEYSILTSGSGLASTFVFHRQVRIQHVLKR